jgi:hypothetical protein
MSVDFFATRLASEDPLDHCRAVLFLCGEGASGEVYLPRLLDICKRTDIGKQSKSEREQSFLVLSARAMGVILRLVGFREDDVLHAGCLQWFEDLSTSGEVDSLFAGIWGFGELGVPPKKPMDRLYQIATGNRHRNEPPQMSSRGLAFRMIANLDRQIAQTIVDRQCCLEYLQGIDLWIAEYEEKYPSNSRLIEGLLDESRWLRG